MKYTVYTKETVYRTFEVETDDDLVAEHDREPLSGSDLVSDYGALEWGEHGMGDLTVVMVEPLEHTRVRNSTSWWTDAWEGEPPSARALQDAGLPVKGNT